ncbi:MAG: phosphodiester glycosidase family protein [Deltaproteobacteria bacterium]|nr:phosphodiester glycosidase family protein [Deltaproteobacteria bacterium]
MRRWRRRSASWLASSVVAGIVLLVDAGRARADCTERDLGGAIVVSSCSDGTPRHWTVLRADLSHADLGLRVTRAAGRGLTPIDWRDSAGIDNAVAIVSGGPFELAEMHPEGLTVAEAEPWSETVDDAAHSVLAAGMQNIAGVFEEERLVPHEPWMRSAISGGRLLVRDGTALGACIGRGCEHAPRTGVGLSEDARSLVLVVVEGWTERSLGATEPELASLLRGAGAWRAFATASGATSALWLSDAPDAVPSSDGAPRVAAVHLALLDVASGQTRRLVGVVETRDGTPLPEASVSVETLDGRAVGEPPALNEGAYFEVRVPIRDYYVVRASMDGYRSGCVLCDVLASRDENWCSLLLDEGDGEETCPVPPRTLDVGPYPIGEPDAGAPVPGPGDGGGESEGGCAIAGRRAARRAGGGDAVVGTLVLVAALARVRRRRATARSRSTPATG